MIIIDLTTYEANFCTKASESKRALEVRSYDIDAEYAMFIYFYDHHFDLSITRYDDSEMTMDIWQKLQHIRFVYPDVDLTECSEVYLCDDNKRISAKINMSKERYYGGQY